MEINDKNPQLFEEWLKFSPHDFFKWLSVEFLYLAYSTREAGKETRVNPYLEFLNVKSIEQLPKRAQKSFKSIFKEINAIENYAERVDQKIHQAVRLAIFLEHIYSSVSPTFNSSRWRKMYKDAKLSETEIDSLIRKAKDSNFKRNAISESDLTNQLKLGFERIFGKPPTIGQLKIMVVSKDDILMNRGYKDTAKLKAWKISSVSVTPIRNSLDSLSEAQRMMLLKSVLQPDFIQTTAEDKTWLLRFVARDILRLSKKTCNAIEKSAIKRKTKGKLKLGA